MANAKLKKAIAGLHKEIGKLEPKAQAAIRKHITVIRTELQRALGSMVAFDQQPPWLGDEGDEDGAHDEGGEGGPAGAGPKAPARRKR